MDNKERFLAIANNIKRDGIDDLLAYCENSDFFTAPASTRYHESYEGGLVEHSLKVYDQLKKLIECYGLDVSEETIAIVALFHDICKAECYDVEMRNVKDKQTKSWYEAPFYVFNEKKKFGGHGSKSVFICMYYMRLTFEEATAINCHMGPNGTDFSCMDAYRQYPLAFLLHAADMAATVPGLNYTQSTEEEDI